MKIKELDINSIKAYARNPRKNEPAVDAVAKSLQEFGWKQPLVIDPATMEIVVGHTRWKAAKKLGMTTVPCLMADDLTEEQIKAYRLADNKTNELAEWDFELLDAELDSILDIDMTDFGFDFENDGDILDTEAEEDDFDAEAELENITEPVSKLGDVWQLGRHRLVCGDSTDRATVEKLMDGKKADIVFTDPPYNTGMKPKKDRSTRLSGMFNDTFTDEEWEKFMSDFCACYSEIMKDDTVAYICLDWRRNHELIPHIKKHFVLSNIIVWDKVVHGLGSDYKYTYELINVCKKGKPKMNTHQGDKEYQDVWHIQRKIGRDDEHATKKPIELVARALRHSSNNEALCVDLFGGSGSTLIACEQLNRKCYMAEIDPKYCDVIIKRWETLTGQKAVLVNGA